MSYLVIEPHLCELLEHAEGEGLQLVIAGGLGIYLKRRWVARETADNGRKNLFDEIPDARVTEDIDAFLGMEVFLREPTDGVSRLRNMLTKLGYKPFEKARYFQFLKELEGERRVKVDLHARLPRDGEGDRVKLVPPRVGRRGTSAFRTLHAWATPEAFAIEERVQTINLSMTTNSGPLATIVRVPHPFASLCMKIKAALDHERTPLAERRPSGDKHAFDIYLLMAMLNEPEFEQVQRLGVQFADNLAASEITDGVRELFSAPERPGCETIRREFKRISMPREPELDLFCPLLGELFAGASATSTPRSS